MNKTAAKDKTAFSPWQLMVVVITANMCGMYFYPRDFSRNSLFVIICATVLVLLSSAMLAYSYGHSKSISFPNLLKESFGGVLARIILAAAAVYFIVNVSCVAVKQTQMTGLFLLEKTPSSVVLAVMLITCAFIIYSGIRQIARTAELMFFVIIIPLVFILILAIFDMDFGELLPLVDFGDVKFEQAVNSVLPFGGIAAASYFAGFYDKSKLTRSLVGGVAVVALLLATVVICCVGAFSVDGTRTLFFPLTELSRIVSLGDASVTERFDILYMIVYTSASLISAGMLMYCACISLCGVFGVKSHRRFIFVLLPIIFILSYYRLSDISLLETISVWGSIIFLFVLIPILFVVRVVKQCMKRVD